LIPGDVHELAGRAVLGGQVEHPVGVEGAGDRVVDGVRLSLGAGERGHVLLETGGLGWSPPNLCRTCSKESKGSAPASGNSSRER
jgi:hypothetical protein